jgi:hypothetical protein
MHHHSPDSALVKLLSAAGNNQVLQQEEARSARRCYPDDLLRPVETSYCDPVSSLRLLLGSGVSPFFSNSTTKKKKRIEKKNSPIESSLLLFQFCFPLAGRKED